MRSALRGVTAVAAILLVSAPAASGAQKPRLSTLGGVPASVQAGGSFRIEGRVGEASRARLTVTLRSSARNVTLRSAKARRSYSLKVTVARATRAGTYTLRACVRRGATKASCKSKRLRVTADPSTAGSDAAARSGHAAAAPATTAEPTATPAAGHSLRPPLTGENFYFVMADRFKNANPANDKGNIASDNPRRPRLRPDEEGLLPRR